MSNTKQLLRDAAEDLRRDAHNLPGGPKLERFLDALIAEYDRQIAFDNARAAEKSFADGPKSTKVTESKSK